MTDRKCIHLVELLSAERPDLKSEIDRHKWFMSERNGYDVGTQAARLDFVKNFLDAWCEGYKVCYCSQVCKGCKDEA